MIPDDRMEKLGVDHQRHSHYGMQGCAADRKAAIALATQLTYVRWHELNHPIGSPEFWRAVRVLFQQYEEQQMAAVCSRQQLHREVRFDPVGNEQSSGRDQNRR